MDNSDGLSRFYLFLLWLFKDTPNPKMAALPRELQRYIIQYVIDKDEGLGNPWATPRPSLSLASIPPPNGASPFMALPTELRRQIFVDSLPEKAVIYHPKCDRVGRVESKKDSSKKPPPPRPNRISDLMTLNKKICAEIAEVVYEERCFVIHVHEGIGAEGGIEFLDAGRQPLQYLDSLEDERFCKFKKEEQFGFRRLKKIIIQIHSATDDNCRHTAINTYFINLALCRLLARGGEKKNRITSLKIEFPKRKSSDTAVGRRAIQREQYWWDPELEKPRETSIKFLPNVELVLRPFVMITGCHSVTIELPENVRHYQPTTEFVENLRSSMMSKYGSMLPDDDFEMKIESARQAMEEYVNYTLHGKGYHDVPKITEAELQEDLMDLDKEVIYISSDDDDDSGSGGRKHDLSPDSKGKGGDWKRKPWQTRSEWEDEQRVMLQSQQSLQEEEDRLFAAAIAASMEDSVVDADSAEQAPFSASFPYEKQVQMNGHNHGSYASVLKAPAPNHSPFKGPGRTLSSSGVSKGNSGQVLGGDLARIPNFHPATGDHPMKQSTGGTANKAPSGLKPTAPSFSPDDVNVRNPSKAWPSYSGVPANMPRPLGSEGPQSSFFQRGQTGRMQPSTGVPRIGSAVEALRVRYGGIPPDSNASATPSPTGGGPGNVKVSQSQLDPTAPKFEGGGRRRSGMLGAQVVGRTANGQDITVTEDGEITYAERRRYARDTEYSAADATSTQRSTLSSPVRGRLSLGGGRLSLGGGQTVSSGGGLEEESIDGVLQ